MISVQDALKTIDQNVKMGRSVLMPLQNALGLALADDVFSPINMPPFAQSAMDGYALKFDGNSTFTVIDEIKAGDGHEIILQPGQAARIFTGAAVPAAADAVVRQEDTVANGNVLEVNPIPKKGANVRPLGEQILKNTVALKKGQELNAATIGFLAGLGITDVKVYTQPKVAVLITGNELAQPGTALKHGQIYESNAIMLASALKAKGFENVEINRVKDDYPSTKDLLKSLLQENEVVLCTGGISVGDYDFVGKALLELGVEQLFYKVRQKPGKPLFFGKKENTLVFALPGNPAAALTCFYIYVVKALNVLMGKKPEGLIRTQKKITTDYIRKGERAQFLKAAIRHSEVIVLEGQSSAMLHTYALSNALVFIDKNEVKKGELVETIII